MSFEIKENTPFVFMGFRVMSAILILKIHTAKWERILSKFTIVYLCTARMKLLRLILKPT